MSAETTAVSLTSSFYLNKYYNANRSCTSTSGRRDFEDCELIYEDSRALRKAARHVGSFAFDEENETVDNILCSIEAYTETYNNAIDSADAVDDTNTKRYEKQLKNLTSKYADELEDIGITIGDDGKLSVSTSLLSAVDFDKVKKAFSGDSTYMKQASSLAKQMNRAANDYIYAQMTGNGLRLNISL